MSCSLFPLPGSLPVSRHSFIPVRQPLTSLFATLVKSPQPRHFISFSFLLFSYTYALFCAFLQSGKNQLFSFHAIPHSLQKKRRPLGEAALLFSFRVLPSTFNCRSKIPTRSGPSTSHGSSVTARGTRGTDHGSPIASHRPASTLSEPLPARILAGAIQGVPYV